MVYTEVQIKNGKKYYYRVKSVRKGKKVEKVREYLGVNLSKKDRNKKEQEADKKLIFNFNTLLTDKEKKDLKKLKEKYLILGNKNWENRYESFLAQFTYDSNAIEGNTLSLQETSFILFEKRTPKGKSLREINEVINHQKAFDYILDYKQDITKDLMCKLQEIIVTNTLRKDLQNQIGKYRDLKVFIRGANFIPPKPLDAKKDMIQLLRWYSQHKKKIHPIILAAYFHVAFETIHPFVDGNGRAGRLLMNYVLRKNKYPMVNIPNNKRLEYYNCLEEARKGNLRTFVRFLYEILMSTEILL